MSLPLLPHPFVIAPIPLTDDLSPLAHAHEIKARRLSAETKSKDVTPRLKKRLFTNRTDGVLRGDLIDHSEFIANGGL